MTAPTLTTITHSDARAVLRIHAAYFGTLDYQPNEPAVRNMAKALSDTFGVPVDEDSFEAGS